MTDSCDGQRTKEHERTDPGDPFAPPRPGRPAHRARCRWARCPRRDPIRTVPSMTQPKKIAIGIVAASIAGGIALTVGSAGSAPGADVTRGPLQPFAAGASLDIGGHAQMVRDRAGTTLVLLH